MGVQTVPRCGLCCAWCFSKLSWHAFGKHVPGFTILLSRNSHYAVSSSYISRFLLSFYGASASFIVAILYFRIPLRILSLPFNGPGRTTFSKNIWAWVEGGGGVIKVRYGRFENRIFSTGDFLITQIIFVTAFLVQCCLVLSVTRSKTYNNPKAACKRTQHCWPTTPNIVGCYMLRPFAHVVGCCCVLLRKVWNRSNV